MTSQYSITPLGVTQLKPETAWIDPMIVAGPVWGI